MPYDRPGSRLIGIAAYLSPVRCAQPLHDRRTVSDTEASGLSCDHPAFNGVTRKEGSRTGKTGGATVDNPGGSMFPALAKRTKGEATFEETSGTALTKLRFFVCATQNETNFPGARFGETKGKTLWTIRPFRGSPLSTA